MRKIWKQWSHLLFIPHTSQLLHTVRGDWLLGKQSGEGKPVVEIVLLQILQEKPAITSHDSTALVLCEGQLTAKVRSRNLERSAGLSSAAPLLISPHIYNVHVCVYILIYNLHVHVCVYILIYNVHVHVFK